MDLTKEPLYEARMAKVDYQNCLTPVLKGRNLESCGYLPASYTPARFNRTFTTCFTSDKNIIINLELMDKIDYKTTIFFMYLSKDKLKFKKNAKF